MRETDDAPGVVETDHDIGLLAAGTVEQHDDIAADAGLELADRVLRFAEPRDLSVEQLLEVGILQERVIRFGVL